MNGYKITDQEFRKFQDLILEKTGIRLGGQKRDLVLSRLTKRLRILNIQTFEDYYQYLSQEENRDEITSMINRITTNVTNFYRENHHFEVLREISLNQIAKRKVAEGTRKIRIWSAGCSTGQEPYTIAFTLADFFQGHVGWDIKILATDLDTEVLATGEKGIYSKEAVTNIPPVQLKQYFKKGKRGNDGFFQVRPQIKNMVVFRQLNLTMERFPIRGPLDVIFCRNVIIYFDKETKANLVGKFYNLLDKGGYLFMGHSESLIAMKEQFNYVHNTVYQKSLT